jgi:hypothetical protein
MQLAHVWQSINGQITTEKKLGFSFFFENMSSSAAAASSLPGG